MRNAASLVRILLLTLLACGGLARLALAQDPMTQRLIEQDPFDRITLNEENKHAVLQVELLDLPSRQLPASPRPDDRLRVKLIAKPDQTYEIAWKHIERVELFEAMVLAEAQQLVADDRLDEAYDALQYLKENFPRTPGLDAQLQAYLYVSAGRLFQQQRWPEALAVLEELHRLNPEYKMSADGRPLTQVLAAVLDRMLAGYLETSDYRTARLFLARIRRDYGEQHAATVNKWQQRIETLAIAERDAAEAFLKDDKFREANRALHKMQAIWPETPRGGELMQQAIARHPIITVGVTQPAKTFDVRRVDDWAARRAGRLTTRHLVEFLRPGVEGGEYAFRYGSLQQSENRRRVTLQLAADQLPTGSTATGYDLARRLLAAATPGDAEYSPTLASLLANVTVRDVMTVDLDLRRPHVAPEAVLQLAWTPRAVSDADDTATGEFRALPVDGNEQSFLARDRASTAISIAEIAERSYDDPAKALAALRHGEVDVLDRVFPADVARLTADSKLRVGRYTLPTLHFLIPSPTRPLAQNATLRRALAYGIDRDRILQQQLLGGIKQTGCRVISGPFSPGTSNNDPLAYAPDPQIALRPYDPRLAATLLGLVDRARRAEAEKEMRDPEPLAIVIGHSQSEVARVACQAIAEQLTAIGLATTIKVLPPGETRDLADECDFTYVEATLNEPIVDARRLLGSDGVARATDPYLNLALRRLDDATNWPDARARLKDIHRIVHADLAIVPLWQLVEHYAWRADVTGLEDNAVSLYENAAAWQHVPIQAATRTVAQP